MIRTRQCIVVVLTDLHPNHAGSLCVAKAREDVSASPQLDTLRRENEILSKAIEAAGASIDTLEASLVDSGISEQIHFGKKKTF